MGRGDPQLSLLGGLETAAVARKPQLGAPGSRPLLWLSAWSGAGPPEEEGARGGRSGGGGQARWYPGHCSARAPGRRCLPSGCGAQRAARSRSPGRCQVAGPASCLHGPGVRRGGGWRPRWWRRMSRRLPGSRPPGQRWRRRLRSGSSALQPAPARPPASLALLSSLWSLALLLPIRLLGLHCRDT